MASEPPAVSSSRLTQAVEFYRHPLEFFEKCYREYGECFSAQVFNFSAPITFLSNPEAVKAIFAADGTDRVESGSIAAPLMETVIGKHSMLILDGEKHRRHRALTMPYFTRAQFARLGDELVELIDRQIESWPFNVRFPIRPKMQDITLQVILRVMFGERATRVIGMDLLRKLFGRTPSPFIFVRALQKDLGPFSPWGRFLRLRAEFYRQVAQERERRLSEESRAVPDILGSLITARDDSEQGLEIQEIVDEIFTLVGAGNDTTATALSWAIYHIFSNGDVLNRLRKEVGRDESNAERIASLPYLDATVREVLRISPIFTFVLRRITEPMQVAGYDLPAGTLVAPSIYLIHRREDLWEQPDRFRPERFLDGRPLASHYFPFGGGIRHCLGAALATYEMKLVLARAVTRTELSIAPGYVPRPHWAVNFLAPSKNVPVIRLLQPQANMRSAS